MLSLVREIHRSLHAFDWGPKQIIERSRNLLAYQLLEDTAFSPKRVLFYLTYNCNLRCRMCWWWGDCGVTPTTDDLSLSEVKSTLDRIARFKPSISFTGGEILTRKDILEILHHAKESGLGCEIFTNATLITPELAKELVRLVDRFMFSVEGSKEIHDLIRGRGSFDRTARGIGLIQEAAEASRRKIATRINCVISSLNLARLDEVVEIAQTLKCRLTFEHLMFSAEQNVDEHRTILHQEFDSEVSSAVGGFLTDYHKVNGSLLTRSLQTVRERADRAGVPIAITPFLRGDSEIRRWYEGTSPIQGMHCAFPWTFLFVRPNGDVAPCEFIDYRLGNALHEDVLQIWNGPRARQFRRILKKGSLPGCFRCCHLIPGLLPNNHSRAVVSKSA